jgi:hypothetical protein
MRKVMTDKSLRQHQWKAFVRNPMFERNLAVRIFMFIMFGFLALELFGLGFVLDKLLLEIGRYEKAISTFNAILPYFFAIDFITKFFFKGNESMQIAPYLTMPIKRNTLFNFLLRKEFTSFWNYYMIFLVVPFSLKAITPYYGIDAAFAYIIAFFAMCIVVSLLVSLINMLISRSFWSYILAGFIVVLPYFLLFVCKIDLGDYTVRFGEALLTFNISAYSAIVVLMVALWLLNRQMMREGLYRELQGEKADKISSFASISFLDRFGAIGDSINLELKMILRSPRLKQQTLFSSAIIIGLFLYMLYVPNNTFSDSGPFIFFLYGIITIGLLGIVMGQIIFSAEGGHFDGLSARPLPLFDILKGKYILYCSYSLLVTLILLVPAFQGKISPFMLISMFFYVIGPVYFLIFQNAVFNKTHYDLYEKGMMNWKGTSGNMIVISMITMFIPVIIMLIINAIWGQTITCIFMSAVGLGFFLTSNYWLTWTYGRFWKRRHRNMEGFRN